MQGKNHPLSWQALGRVVLLGAIILLVWKAQDVLVSILVALILATAIYPLVRFFHKKLPMLWATILSFAVALVPFVLIAIFVMPLIVEQTPQLVSTLHMILSRMTFLPESVRSVDVTSYLVQHSGDVLTSTKSVAFGIFTVVTTVFMAFYFVLDNERFLHFFIDLFPASEHRRVESTLKEVASVNGRYIRGNLLISLICALYLYIVLVFLHVPFALPLAIFAGILDLLPLVGSTLGTIPALVIGYTISPLVGTVILVLHLVYQQLENVVISPAVYHKALDISPALSFISVVVGGGLFGMLGAFLALPVAASLPAMVRYLRHYQKEVHAHAAS